MATIPIVAAIKDFDKLTRELAAAKEATRLARIEAKGLKETNDEIGKGQAMGQMAKQAASFAAGLLGVNSAGAIMQKIVAAAKEDFRQMVELQNRAAGAQASVSNAVGEYLLNSSLSTVGEGKDLLSFARDQGAALGPDGASRVMAAATAAMNQVPNASGEQLRSAVGYGIQANRISDKFDIGSFAVGLLKTQEELGGSMEQASNLLLTLGARSGGDFAAIVSQIGKLKALSGSATSTALPEILASFGFLTQALGDQTGDGTTTTIGNLLSRVSTRDISIGGKPVQLAAESGDERIVELAERIGSGEFGNPTAALADLAQSLGRESAGSTTAIAAFVKSLDQFTEARDRMNEALTRPDSLLQELRQRKLEIMPESASIEGTRAALGAADTALGQSTIEGEWGRVRERMQAFADQYGIRSGFDFGKDAREMAAMYSGQNPMEWEQAERRRLLSTRLRGMAPGFGGVGAAGAAGMAAPGDDPFAGMSETDMLRAALRLGGVSPAGGFSSTESAMLQTVGIAPETIAEWNALFLNGMKEVMKDAYLEAMREAMREAQAQPAPDALNPGQ